MKVLTSTAAIVLALAVSGCANLPWVGAPRNEGHLVIIGGGLRESNAPVFERIMDLSGSNGTIAIIPTASGVPEESGPLTLADFEIHGASGEVIDITLNNMEEAANSEKAEQILRHNAIFFTGGWQERIVEAFRPNGEPTVADDAVRLVLERGGVVAGTSAGAAMMSDPMIRWGDSASALELGHSCDEEDMAVCTMRGMDFFPYGLTDQHFQTRGRLGRLVVAMHALDEKFGFGVDDNRAMVVNLATHEVTLLGRQALVFVDARKSRHDDDGYHNLRVSILGEGDTVNARNGRITTGSRRSAIEPASTPPAPPTIASAWDAHVFADAADWMARAGADHIIIPAEEWQVELIADDDTLFLDSPQRNDTTVVNLRVDIVRSNLEQ